MKLSEFIAELQKAMEDYGDCKVFIPEPRKPEAGEYIEDFVVPFIKLDCGSQGRFILIDWMG